MSVTAWFLAFAVGYSLWIALIVWYSSRTWRVKHGNEDGR